MRIGLQAFSDALREILWNAFDMPEIHSAVIKGHHLSANSSESEIQKACADSYHDILSDMDIEFYVSPSDNAILLDRLGITPQRWLGCLYNDGLYRVILKNGLRYDLSFVLDDGSRQQGVAPSAVDAFWFIQVQALAKLYRGDYLIADHLVNMNVNETLVQQMILRDQKYETNFHRYGYKEELAYQNVEPCPYVRADSSSCSIANKLYAAAITYDRLALQLDSTHESRSDDFIKLWEAYHEHGAGSGCER